MVLRQPKTPEIPLLALRSVPETYIFDCPTRWQIFIFWGWISVRGTAESVGSKAATQAGGDCLLQRQDSFTESVKQPWCGTVQSWPLARGSHNLSGKTSRKINKGLQRKCSQGDLGSSGCSAAGRSHDGLVDCLKVESLKAGTGGGGGVKPNRSFSIYNDLE